MDVSAETSGVGRPWKKKGYVREMRLILKHQSGDVRKGNNNNHNEKIGTSRQSVDSFLGNDFEHGVAINGEDIVHGDAIMKAGSMHGESAFLDGLFKVAGSCIQLHEIKSYAKVVKEGVMVHKLLAQGKVNDVVESYSLCTTPLVVDIETN